MMIKTSGHSRRLLSDNARSSCQRYRGEMKALPLTPLRASSKIVPSGMLTMRSAVAAVLPNMVAGLLRDHWCTVHDLDTDDIRPSLHNGSLPKRYERVGY